MTCSSQASASKASPKVWKIDETGAFTTIILVGKQLQRPLLTRICVGFSPEYCWDLQTGQPCGVTFGQCGSPRRGGSRLALESGR